MPRVLLCWAKRPWWDHSRDLFPTVSLWHTRSSAASVKPHGYHHDRGHGERKELWLPL